MSNFGDAFKKAASLNGKSLGKGLGESIGAIGGLAGGAIGKALNNKGLESTAGGIFDTIGSIGSAIPGPLGAIIGGGAKIIGGAVNAAFGTKEDKQLLNAANQGTNYLNSFVSDASSFDAIQGPRAQEAIGDVYTGGWFTKGKAARKNEALLEQRQLAQNFADRSVENNVSNLTSEQMNNMLANYAAFGGVLSTNGADWKNGITIINSGGTHESNPFEGVPMGIAPDGKPNLVEEGEVIYNDYVFSNRLKVPKKVREMYKLKGGDEMTFAEAAKKAQKESEERPNDPISKRGLEDIMNKLMMEQEVIREKREKRKAKYAYGGALGTLYAGPGGKPNYLDIEDDTPVVVGYTKRGALTEDGTINPDYTSPRQGAAVYSGNAYSTNNKSNENQDEDTLSILSGLRFVPAIGAGIGALSDAFGWTNTPDYSNAQSILRATDNINKVKYTPIGDYIRYTPLDRLFYANQFGAQAGATRRNIMNTSGGNRGTAMAGLLAADYNAQRQLGSLYRQAEEYNAAQREKVATFNRGTNMFNAENSLKAQIANKEDAKLYLEAAAKAAALRDAEDTRVAAARSANLTNFFDSLGDIGREVYAMDMVKNNKGLLYDQLGRYKNEIVSAASGEERGNANGGFITIKKRRRK